MRILSAFIARMRPHRNSVAIPRFLGRNFTINHIATLFMYEYNFFLLFFKYKNKEAFSQRLPLFQYTFRLYKKIPREIRGILPY